MAKFEHNQDGSVIVTLSESITVGKETLEKVTIPALRGAHMRVCPFVAGSESYRVEEFVEFAARIVIPVGAVDAMAPADAIEVGSEVATLMGKLRKGG